MTLRKVFRVGNTTAVSLDPGLMEKYGFSLGLRVAQYDTGQGILIKPVKKTQGLPSDLVSWLTKFEKRHAKALRKLARA